MVKPYIENHVKKFFDELSTYKYYFGITLKEQDKLAKAIQDRHDEIAKGFDYENDDDGIVWSRAHEDVMGSDEVWISEHELFIVGGYCIIIFHAFERYLEDAFDLIIKSDLPEMLNTAISVYQKRAIEKVLKSGKLDQFSSFCDIFPSVKTVKAYEKTYELNVICNVFKHGTGRSLELLRKIRPDVTRYLDDKISLSRTVRPFRGYDLRVKREMVYEYLDAIKGFLIKVFDITL